MNISIHNTKVSK